MPDVLRVLVVDDEDPINELLVAMLRHEGFEAASAFSGSEALELVSTFLPDAVLLDVMLPDVDGFEVARRLRSGGNLVPVLFLSARDGVEDRIEGISLGADDYVVKPFSLAEVLVRLRAVLRRSGRLAPATTLSFSDLSLDTASRVVSRAGVPVELTDTEFRLLRHFLESPGRVLPRKELLQAVWSYDFGGEDNVLDTYVSYLRRKLDPLGVPLLHTVRGVGYVLRDPR